MSKLATQVADFAVETDGDVIILENGETEKVHVISPEADVEGMRIVGALGEMLYEQIKKAFGTNPMFLVCQNKDFKLVMFLRKDGFAVWKTNLNFPRIASAIGSNKDGR